jgi:hypothetical protein
MDRSVKLSLSTDKNFSSKLNNLSLAFIGSKIYGRISWEIPSLENKLQFFIENCKVDIQDQIINIIDQNCYLKTLGAKLEGDGHVQSSHSTFSFTSFTIFNSKNLRGQKEDVICDIRICLHGKCELNQNCANIHPGLEYSINGV